MWYAYDSNVTFPGKQQQAQRRICTTDNVNFSHGCHRKKSPMISWEISSRLHSTISFPPVSLQYILLIWGENPRYTQYSENKYIHEAKYLKMNDMTPYRFSSSTQNHLVELPWMGWKRLKDRKQLQHKDKGYGSSSAWRGNGWGIKVLKTREGEREKHLSI